MNMSFMGIMKKVLPGVLLGKKYGFTNEKKRHNGITLHRIRALKDFGNVKAGDLGGWIEKEENLSHDGNCWVAGNAYVYGDAYVYENAKVYGNALVFGNVRVYGYAHVYGNAKVYGHSQVYEYAHVYGNAYVYEYARVYEYAHVYGNAKVYGHSQVYGNAKVYEYACVGGYARVYGNVSVYGYALIHGEAYVHGEARVYGNAHVYGDAYVYGYAIIKENMKVSYSKCITDLSMNLVESIRCQTGLQAFGDYVIAFKHVKGDLSSLHDKNFKYVVGEWIEAKNPDMDKTVSCGGGLHVSNATHWEGHGGEILLMCKVMLEDIITVQQGKIRCKKLFVMDSSSGIGKDAVGDIIDMQCNIDLITKPVGYNK